MPRLLVNVDVDALDGAVRFYTRALELRVGRRFGAAAVELVGADTPLYLLAEAPASAPFDGAAAPRSYARHWTPVHLDFVVDDIDEAVARAEAAGARVERAVSERPWGKLAVLSDPFGHGFCLIQFVGRGYDAVATEG